MEMGYMKESYTDIKKKIEYNIKTIQQKKQ